ncbi:alpha/beta hydrolase [Terracidiphilus sp.]|jgi:esterase/lipase superfamily enzyme|uniref:alpha/beta hydrolase n=1 Tax=Terracidiphilus sp. TaxID=1964191 RepID=UPI003C17D53B
MSPLYVVRLSGSFQMLLVQMPDSVRKEVLDILNALKADAHFIPSETEYRITRSADDAVVCAKIDGWDGWSLSWHLEFASGNLDQPIVMLSAISPGVTGAGLAPQAGTRDLPTYMAPPAAMPQMIQEQQAQIQQGETPEPTAAAQDPNLSYVRVFYSTDREETIQFGVGPQYGPGRSQGGVLHYGECEISIPKTHKLGMLESPSILRLEFKPDPQKHIVLASIESLEEQAFLTAVADAVDESATREAFVFVHGFNVAFADAARRTGQIAFDLNFVGAPILYSWPSNGRVEDYTFDETNAQWSQDHFKRFLCLLAQNVKAEKIHVIAHSMGNRVVCGALKELSLQADNPVALSQIVLAAPDMDADTFKELAAMLGKLSKGVTLYQSSKDKALLASKKIHGNPRAGEPVLVIQGLDSIDASAVDTDFLGHGYFADTWALLSDIHALLANAEPAARRVGMVVRQTADGAYYAFRGA